MIYFQMVDYKIQQDLTRLSSKAVDKEAICLSRVYSYYYMCNLPLFYV